LGPKLEARIFKHTTEQQAIAIALLQNASVSIKRSKSLLYTSK